MTNKPPPELSLQRSETYPCGQGGAISYSQHGQKAFVQFKTFGKNGTRRPSTPNDLAEWVSHMSPDSKLAKTLSWEHGKHQLGPHTKCILRAKRDKLDIIRNSLPRHLLSILGL